MSEEEKLKKMTEEFQPHKQQLEEKLITGLLNYVKEGTAPKKDLSSYIDCYNIIYSLTDRNMGDILVKYHNEIIEKEVTECFEKIKDLSDIEFIDSVIIYTERLNLFFYEMSTIFKYISTNHLHAAEDRNNNRIYTQDDISEFSMDIYKKNFYDKLKEKIDGIIKGDAVNEEKKNKIKTIISYLEFKKPKIKKEGANSFIWMETYKEKQEEKPEENEEKKDEPIKEEKESE